MDNNPGRDRVFLFMNISGQGPDDFYQTGGHIVLRFWKEFQKIFRQGRLILHCAKPGDDDLSGQGVDASFVNREIGKSIYWFNDYLSEKEKNSLIASARFLLMPGRYLQSETLLRAMEFGTIPVVSDTVGTSGFVRDHEHGIVIRGVREAAWVKDPSTGLLIASSRSAPELDSDLVEQMLHRISEFIKTPGCVGDMRERIAEHSRLHFSGEAFSSHFWQTVKHLHSSGHRRFSSNEKNSDLFGGLRQCLLMKEKFTGLFNSEPGPLVRINTGLSRVWEAGGSIIQTPGPQNPDQRNESADAHPWNPGAADIKVAADIHELDGAYLSPTMKRKKPASGVTAFMSKLLMGFPVLHHAAFTLIRRCIAKKPL